VKNSLRVTTLSPFSESGSHCLKKLLFLSAAILLVTALIVPAASARDVRIAITDLRPSLYTDEQGKPAGLFVDIIDDIAAQEDWNVIWVRGTLSESWGRLSSGEIDLLPGVTSTPERLNSYDFNNESALSIWSQIYARPGSGISTILDLDGKKVATVRRAASGIGFLDYAGKFNINVTLLEKDTPVEIFSATAKGEADALVVYNTAAQDDAKIYGLVATPVIFNPTRFGFAVQKGKNQELLTVIDRYLVEGKANPTSPYNNAMRKWFGLKGTSEVIPLWVWWGLALVAGLAGLFVIMSVILRREVRRKTAELSRQNETLQAEVANRARAEAELKTKNRELSEAYGRLTATEEEIRQNYQELNAAYEQMTATEEELREKYEELRKNEQALMQARKKLSSLNALTFDDLRNAVFSLDGYIGLAQHDPSGERVGTFLGKSEEILHSVRHAMEAAKKYQDLGINPPRWQNVKIVLLNAISHLDFLGVSRTADLGGLEIYADPLLEDVFFILMENILVHGKGATEVRINYREEADSLTIIIEDNGPGIPEADKEKIFGRGYRGTKGGSGLFLAREILSITGITITENGKESAGARFEIRVPKGAYRLPEP
jgi:ABC-type amino acid transport substrate-binding protein